MSTILAYVLVRGPRYRWGIGLATWAILLAVWFPFVRDGDAGLLFFTVVPVLLGGLLMGFWPALVLGVANLLAAALLPWAVHDASLAGWPEWTDVLLFLVAMTLVILVGTQFLGRSLRDVDEANQRLHQADRFRLDLLNTVAHDLAAPLTPLALQVRLLRKEKTRSRSLEIMERNLMLLKRLVGDIKDLALVQSQGMALQRRPVALHRLVEETVEGFRPAAHDKGLDLALQPSPEAVVQGDPDRLAQALNNLVTNALKFSKSGGVVQVGVFPRDRGAEVHVRDSGRGLEPDEMRRLFLPFSQVHERKEVEERGTGLGLYITKGIVEAHGGRIWVRSDGKGQGSTFGFFIPA